MDSTDDSAAFAAVREFCEEHLGEHDLLKARRQLSTWEHDSAITGPYGSTRFNSGFLLAVENLDEVLASFAPNRELKEIRCVSLHHLTGSEYTEQLPGGETLVMRNHLGYLRVQAAKTLLPRARAQAQVPVRSDELGAEKEKKRRRQVRFSVPVDAPATAQQVLQARQSSFAHKPSGTLTRLEGKLRQSGAADQQQLQVGEVAEGYEWPTVRLGMNCQGGRRRPGDIHSLAEAAGEACITTDLKGGVLRNTVVCWDASRALVSQRL